MEKEVYRFKISEKQIIVYPSAVPDRPVLYLNTYGEEGCRVYEALQEEACPDFTLAAVSELEWDHDMAPWDIPSISKGFAPCTGGADAYLRFLENEIMPEVEKRIPGKALWRGLAGYSLGGLFAVYALYQTDLFSRAASISGSFWFPNFREYIFSNEMKRQPDRLYLSLGDRESRTGNTVLRTVQENTEEIAAFFRKKGIETCFQLNPGGHHKNAVQRTASGLRWLLADG